MATRGWARCNDNVADVLRRGAWYPIVEETDDDHVIVEVRNRRVRLTRADIRVRHDPPERWSVVVRTGVLRPTLGGREVSRTYAVCPSCHQRVEFTGTPAILECSGCGKSAAVDWSETC